MKTLRLSDVKPMFRLSFETKKHLEKLTLHHEIDKSSLMYEELQIDPSRRDTNVVLGFDTVGKVYAWGLISETDLIQIYVHKKYRSHNNGTRIAAKLVQMSEPKQRPLYTMAHSRLPA